MFSNPQSTSAVAQSRANSATAQQAPTAQQVPAAPTQPLISAEDLQKLKEQNSQLKNAATKFRDESEEYKQKLNKSTFRSLFEWTKENPKSARQLFVVGFIAIFVLIIIIYMITLPEPECSYLNKQLVQDISSKIGLNGFVLRVDLNLTNSSISSSTPLNLVTVATSDSIKSSNWAPSDAIELVIDQGHPRLTLYGINIDTAKVAYFDDYTIPVDRDVELRLICHENMCVLRAIEANSAAAEVFKIRKLARLERELTFKYIKVGYNNIGRHRGKIPKVELYEMQDKKMVVDECYLNE